MSTHTTQTAPTHAEPIRFPSDAEVDADIRRSLHEINEAKSQAPSHEELCAAIAQLKYKSDRGRAVLKRFNSMVQAYGFGLDTNNWRALITLHRAAAAGQVHRILQLQEVGK